MRKVYALWVCLLISVPCVVTAKTQYSLTNAKDYFTEHLCVGDYYEEGQRVPNGLTLGFKATFWTTADKLRDAMLTKLVSGEFCIPPAVQIAEIHR